MEFPDERNITRWKSEFLKTKWSVKKLQYYFVCHHIKIVMITRIKKKIKSCWDDFQLFEKRSSQQQLQIFVLTYRYRKVRKKLNYFCESQKICIECLNHWYFIALYSPNWDSQQEIIIFITWEKQSSLELIYLSFFDYYFTFLLLNK